MRFSCTTFALLAMIAIPAAARADNFIITEGGNTLTFGLPASPTPSSSYPDEVFYINNVSVVYDGVSSTDDIDFFTNDDDGGFADNFFGDPFDGQYFTGDVTAPTFTPGTFSFSGEPGGATEGFITISASTPEPSSLFLLGTGALGLAGAVRRRLRK